MCMVLFPSSKLAIAVFTATTLERSHVEAVIGKKQTFALLDLLRPVYTPSIPRLFPPNLSLIFFLLNVLKFFLKNMKNYKLSQNL